MAGTGAHRFLLRARGEVGDRDTRAFWRHLQRAAGMLVIPWLLAVNCASEKADPFHELCKAVGSSLDWKLGAYGECEDNHELYVVTPDPSSALRERAVRLGIAPSIDPASDAWAATCARICFKRGGVRVRRGNDLHFNACHVANLCDCEQEVEATLRRAPLEAEIPCPGRA